MRSSRKSTRLYVYCKIRTSVRATVVSQKVHKDGNASFTDSAHVAKSRDAVLVACCKRDAHSAPLVATR